MKENSYFLHLCCPTKSPFHLALLQAFLCNNQQGYNFSVLEIAH